MTTEQNQNVLNTDHWKLASQFSELEALKGEYTTKQGEKFVVSDLSTRPNMKFWPVICFINNNDEPSYYSFKRIYELISTGIIVKKEVIKKPFTTGQVINELINNDDYRENLEEILTLYFKQNTARLASWKEWFDGK